MASQPLYQLYLELEDYEPKIWRRIQVMNNIKFARLGYIIMTLFEMQASHLYEFEIDLLENFKRRDREFWEEDSDAESRIKKRRVGILDEDNIYDFNNLEGYEPLKDSTEEYVKHYIYDENDEMIFKYDFGDNWRVKVKIEKREILDFVRGITPFLYEICKYALNNICKINITKYCSKDRRGVMYLTRQLMDTDSQGKEVLKMLDFEFSKNKSGKYNDTFLSEKQMLTILYAKLDDDSKLRLSLKMLNSLREEIRNIASHQITCVREEDIIKKLGKSVDDYVNIIRIVLACLNFDTSKYWNSYNLMNEKIIEEINKLR